MHMTKKLIYSFFAAYFLLAAFVTSGCSMAKDSSSNIQNVQYNGEKNIYSCSYNGIERNFILCMPENYNGETKVVLLLHGLGGSAAAFKEQTQFEQKAAELNYAAVFVEGTVDPANRSHGKGWHFYEDDFSKNDVSFLKELVLYLQKEYGINSKAFVIGFSNGGFMVNKLASYCPDFFTAAVSVGGMMPKDVWEGKKSKHPCAFIQINGTKDDVVPMDFNDSSKFNPNPSMEKVIEYYRKGNRCPSLPEEIKLSENATMFSYGTKVAWVIIDGGYHSWPVPQFAGIETSSVILDFFEKQG